MGNHNRRLRYYYACPRGFANEITYIQVRPEEVAAVEAHFDGWIDRKFDAGDTGADCGWTEGNAAHSADARRGGALSWHEYLDTFVYY